MLNVIYSRGGENEMNKRLSILFIFILIFQTISSSVALPSQTSAEGSEQSIFTGISLTDEDGKEINIEDVRGESVVNVHIDWSVSHVEVGEGSAESLTLASELHVEAVQQDALTDGETELGTYEATTDGVVTVESNEAVEDHSEATGTRSEEHTSELQS